MHRDKSRIKATRHVNVFAELSHGNSVLLENAKGDGQWGHPSMLDGGLQTLNVNGWVAP